MKSFTAIVDYGVGNLYSIENAFNHLGLPCKITGEAADLEQAAGILLPGVGAFADAAEQLHASGLVDVLIEEASKKPLLGICLGMQLLFNQSEEGKPAQGLGLIEGRCEKIPTNENLPQIGWNELKIAPSPLLQGLERGEYVYFVHSYHCVPSDPEHIIATTDYGCPVTAAVQKGNIFGCQFHPEKSGEAGLKILSNFGAML